MKEIIRDRLSEVEAEHGCRIFYACESGSRAWGFASEDSDYDIRFLYCWPRERYLEIHHPPEQFDFGVDDDYLDLSGWELRKALLLFQKANGPLMEWLLSPVVYHEDREVMERWRTLIPRFFVPRHAAAHYFGLSRKIWNGIEETEFTTAKKYLYALRSLLACRFVVERGKAIPVEFDLLRENLPLPDEINGEISSIIAEKAKGKESDLIPRCGILDSFISGEQDRFGGAIGELDCNPGDAEVLNSFFREVIS